MISNRLIGLPSQLTANRPRDNREDIHRYHTLPDHCVSSTIKIRQPKQILPTENTTGNSWPAGQMCRLDKQGRNSKQEIAACVLSPLNQGNKVLLSRTLERYKDLKPTVHILPFLLLTALRGKELSRTDVKANDSASNLLVYPSVPVRLSKHLLGFLETTETTNQHDGLSGPLPSHPGLLSPQSPSDVRPVVGI